MYTRSYANTKAGAWAPDKANRQPFWIGQRFCCQCIGLAMHTFLCRRTPILSVGQLVRKLRSVARRSCTNGVNFKATSLYNSIHKVFGQAKWFGSVDSGCNAPCPPGSTACTGTSCLASCIWLPAQQRPPTHVILRDVTKESAIAHQSAPENLLKTRLSNKRSTKYHAQRQGEL